MSITYFLKNLKINYAIFSLLFLIQPYITTSTAIAQTSDTQETINNKLETALLKLKQQRVLVLKLNERKLYVYQGNNLQASYPVAVGKKGWETPTGKFKVIQMLENPGWTNFVTGERVLPGPNNPLGERWIAFWNDNKDLIGFHGTPDRKSVGLAISHGCVRLYNEHINYLYDMVTIGTSVIVEH